MSSQSDSATERQSDLAVAKDQESSPKSTAPEPTHVDVSAVADPADQNDADDSVPDPATETARDSTPNRSRSSSIESGEASPVRDVKYKTDHSAPPLPDEAPPLPNEAPPPSEDDGWDFHWSEEAQAYYFYNRFTGATTWENPRLATKSTTAAVAAAAPSQVDSTTATTVPPAPANETLPAGGYNPAIHGDYDPNAWYAQKPATDEAAESSVSGTVGDYATMGSFNRFTGAWQAGGDDQVSRHNDENKSRRQMNAFFDVDAVANSHDGRSLKAERSGKKPTKAELKAFKEKRKARKEEKRRAWLRD